MLRLLVYGFAIEPAPHGPSQLMWRQRDVTCHQTYTYSCVPPLIITIQTTTYLGVSHSVHCFFIIYSYFFSTFIIIVTLIQTVRLFFFKFSVHLSVDYTSIFSLEWCFDCVPPSCHQTSTSPLRASFFKCTFLEKYNRHKESFQIKVAANTICYNFYSENYFLPLTFTEIFQKNDIKF